MNQMISVIIPVYNVEKYLDRCLESIINQSYKNLEIILVNDGSTDNSGKLCDEWALKDSRISVYHKENEGASSARNLGLKKSKGFYIGFIDSDDYIDLDMYELLYNNINKYHADISMCGLYNIYINKVEDQEKNIRHYLFNPEEAIKTVLDSKITSVTAVNKLYKKSLFKNLEFDTKIVSAEDALIIIKLLDECKIISITNEKKYYYYHRSNSVTTKPFSKSTLNVIDVYRQHLDFISKKYPNIVYSAKRRLYWSYFYVLDLLLISDEYNSYKDLSYKLIMELRNNIFFIMKSPHFTVKRKLLFVTLLCNRKLYSKLILKFKNKVYS